MLPIHNRYLPQWLHRIANGVLAAGITVTVASWGLDAFSETALLVRLFSGLLYASPIVGLVAALLTHKISIVEGIAGGDRYDELKGGRGLTSA